MDTKSDLISTKLDMMIFNNVIQNLLEGELKLTEIFDEVKYIIVDLLSLAFLKYSTQFKIISRTKYGVRL